MGPALLLLRRALGPDKGATDGLNAHWRRRSLVLPFYPDGAAALKGYVQGIPLRPEVWNELPEDFHADFREEAAFDREATTFCFWRHAQDSEWQRSHPTGDDLDGGADLLALLDGNPSTYQEWAEEYFETAVPLPAVEHVYAHHPLTPAVIAALNPEWEIVNQLAADLTEIGYPTAS